MARATRSTWVSSIQHRLGAAVLCAMLVLSLLAESTTTGQAAGPVASYSYSAFASAFYLPTAVNAYGQVTGIVTSNDFTTSHAFIFTPTTPNGSSGIVTDLGSLGGTGSESWTINDYGQIGGDIDFADGSRHGFIWTPSSPHGASGTVSDLINLGVEQVQRINNKGQAVGTMNVNPGGFVWTPVSDNGTVGNLTVLPTLGGDESWGNSINDYGQIVGESATTDYQHRTVLWTPDQQNGSSFTLTDLGSGEPPLRTY